MRLAPASRPSHARQFALLGISFLLAACAGVTQPTSQSSAEPVRPPPAPAPAEPSLFERLGGTPALEIVVDETVDHAARDPRTSRAFKGDKLESVKQQVVGVLSCLSGGPCAAQVRPAHYGLNLTDEEFSAFNEMLSETLDKYAKVSDKNELMGVIMSMKPRIVAR